MAEHHALSSRITMIGAPAFLILFVSCCVYSRVCGIQLLHRNLLTLLPYVTVTAVFCITDFLDALPKSPFTKDFWITWGAALLICALFELIRCGITEGFRQMPGLVLALVLGDSDLTEEQPLLHFLLNLLVIAGVSLPCAALSGLGVKLFCR